MKQRNYFLILFALLGLSFWIPNRPIIYPSYFPEPVYDFSKNNLDHTKIELGRNLFYDEALSRDSSISCASCHSPYNAFAHTDHDLSHGIDDQISSRNAPPLFNLAWQSSFMWDGAIHHLDVQALAPISNPEEMDADINVIVYRLQKDSLYREAFKNAFGESKISGEQILKALSAFQLSLVSSNSKYDLVKKDQAKFTEQEDKGYQLFQVHCNSCHQEPLFSTYQFANNGLSIDTTLNDVGLFGVSQEEKDRLLFKIPSLRNLSYTFPYMHDGRFQKLRDVLNHYKKGITVSPTLDPSLENRIPLSDKEQSDLIAFLLTLNDKSFVFDTKHQYPKEFFKQREGF